MSYKTIQLSKAADIIVGFPFASEKFNINAQGTRLVRGKNITTGNLRWGDDTRWWDDSSIDLSKYMLKADDIVIGMDGSLVGKNYAKISENDLPLLLVQRVACIRAKEGYDQRFLWGCIASGKFERYIDSIKTGTSIPHISGGQIGNYLIPDFDLPTQKKIAAILSALDEKIAINRAINDNLQQQAFSVFDNLIANAENNDYTVSDYAFLNPKRTLAKNQVARSIDMSQLSTSGAFPSGWEMKPFNGGMRFTNGDTLLARITPCLENGKTAFIDFLDDGEVAFGSTEYIVLAPKNDTPPEMLYCLARYPAFVDYAVKNMNGSSGRQRVSAETVGQYRLPLFDKHSLVLFKEVVSPMFLKMRYNSLENMRLAELRDALLPKLMSGEVDVSDIQL